jgi:hypothetical protein
MVPVSDAIEDVTPGNATSHSLKRRLCGTATVLAVAPPAYFPDVRSWHCVTSFAGPNGDA